MPRKPRNERVVSDRAPACPLCGHAHFSHEPHWFDESGVTPPEMFEPSKDASRKIADRVIAELAPYSDSRRPIGITLAEAQAVELIYRAHQQRPPVAIGGRGTIAGVPVIIVEAL